MAQKVIYRHECDYCKAQFDETQESGFLPCEGANKWSAWNLIRKRGTASSFYSTNNAALEFCSYRCAINWMEGQIKNEQKK